MKKQVNKVVNKLNKTGAVFLVGLIFSLSLLQAFHWHPDELSCEHFGTRQKEERHNFQVEKCKICDYLIHKKGKEICSDTICLQAQLLPLPVREAGYLHTGTSSFTLQGFINKGPPPAASF